MRIKLIQNIIDIIRQKNNPSDSYTNFEKHKKQAKLTYFEVHLANHCNLNCQSCTHFSSIADAQFPSLEIYSKDIKRISELTEGDVDTISLMGGEPLLNPEICKYIDVTRNYFKQTKLQLVTNGILLKSMNENFWENLSKNNIVVRPTKYPINIDWQYIQNKCNEKNITLEFYNDANVLKTSFKFPLNLKGNSNQEQEFAKCWVANSCLFLQNGRMYTCSYAGNIQHFNKYFGKNLPSIENGIDIYKAKGIDEILEFMIKPTPLCKYCYASKFHDGNEWNITNKSIKEWI